MSAEPYALANTNAPFLTTATAIPGGAYRFSTASIAASILSTPTPSTTIGGEVLSPEPPHAVSENAATSNIENFTLIGRMAIWTVAADDCSERKWVVRTSAAD
jgi:hypothetical protein